MKITFEFATQDDCLDRMVPSDLRVLVAQRDRLQAQVAQLYNLIKYARVESGVCMCGDNMQDHNQASGHSPVDVWDHAVEQVDKEGSSEAFILRKQAEAVEDFSFHLFVECQAGSNEDSDAHRKAYSEFFVKRLRNDADKAGGDV